MYEKIKTLVNSNNNIYEKLKIFVNSDNNILYITGALIIIAVVIFIAVYFTITKPTNTNKINKLPTNASKNISSKNSSKNTLTNTPTNTPTNTSRIITKIKEQIPSELQISQKANPLFTTQIRFEYHLGKRQTDHKFACSRIVLLDENDIEIIPLIVDEYPTFQYGTPETYKSAKDLFQGPRQEKDAPNFYYCINNISVPLVLTIPPTIIKKIIFYGRSLTNCRGCSNYQLSYQATLVNSYGNVIKSTRISGFIPLQILKF